MLTAFGTMISRAAWRLPGLFSSLNFDGGFGIPSRENV
jgi:hypothetical protein